MAQNYEQGKMKQNRPQMLQEMTKINGSIMLHDCGILLSNVFHVGL